MEPSQFEEWAERVCRDWRLTELTALQVHIWESKAEKLSDVAKHIMALKRERCLEIAKEVTG